MKRKTSLCDVLKVKNYVMKERLKTKMIIFRQKQGRGGRVLGKKVWDNRTEAKIEVLAETLTK